MHLALVLPFPSLEESGLKGIGPAEREQAEIQARAYLDLITQRLSKGELASLQLQVTSSVAIQGDVAETLIGMAETGAFLEGGEPFHGCYVLALATHGRSGVERWVMGSVTERILGATILPLLIVRSRETDTGEEGERNVTTAVTKGTEDHGRVGLF